jgi:hypothetical protein
MKSMSAIGPQQTSSAAPQMSALGGKADMPLCAANVCFWTQSGHCCRNAPARFRFP